MSAELNRTKTIDATVDKYDHEIRLIDSSVTGGEDGQGQTDSRSWRRLARKPTQISVKEQLARRKYASWRKDRFDAGDAGEEAPIREAADPSKVVTEAHPDNEQSQTVDFGKRPDTAQGAQSSKKSKRNTKHKKGKSESEIDILYENQRGAFFCGIPLYSHSSLLNFDPAAWVTRDFKNSPVNIMNAQVPDPSWMWAWKTWYVDMSHDVDEEGWQYSFTFGKNFAWHGTHPWFHSFVRRRRWLRKRVKRDDGMNRKSKEGTMEAAHHLNTDYFTIHSKARDRSPGSAINPDAQLARPASYTGSIASLDDESEKLEEIEDIPALMKAVRHCTIDREKVDMVKLFITTGGDELYYLADAIPEILSTFVFQNTRTQVLRYLQQQAEAAKQHREDHDAEDRPEGEDETRHIDNLLKAAEAVQQQSTGLEYWSDRKHVLQTHDEYTQSVDKPPTQTTDILGKIIGISDKAETSKEIRVDRRLLNKGKTRERLEPNSYPSIEEENADERAKRLGRPSLGRDNILVRDEDEDNAS